VKRNILITGGAGFIGSHLVDALLLNPDISVSVIDDFNPYYPPESKRRNIAQHLSNPQFRLYETDITDDESLKQVFEGQSFDTVVHLAARAGVRQSLIEPAAYARTNIEGTINLLECVREKKIPKFIFGSSSSVYGQGAPTPFSEAEANVGKILSPYAATKVAGEAVCRAFAETYGINTICLRFFTVYGPRQRPDLAIHKFAALISSGQPIPVFGDGSSFRDYTYVGDIVDGICAAMDYDSRGFEVINLGTSHTITLSELIRLIGEGMEKEIRVEQLPMQPGDLSATCADISKAKRLLNYSPKVPLQEGISKFIDWFETGSVAS